MKVIDSLETLDPPLKRSVLTIGNFDGVHRAHQQLLAQAGLFATNTGGPVVVLTFEPHPLSVVAPQKVPKLLSTLKEKLRCLARAGADITVIARSEPGLLSLEPETFLEKVIWELFHPTHIVEGPSFRFGRSRRGTPELLSRVARGLGCEVHIVKPVTVQIEQGETLLVSSSLIRRLLGEGKVRRAGLCLGRSYALVGQVAQGAGRGRTLGFPTANLAGIEQLIPADGVYAGRAVVQVHTYPAAISIGSTPTFGGRERQVEAHLLDFAGDLYGKTIRIEFTRRLREQKKFESPEALARQVGLDVEAARTSYEQSRPPPEDREVSAL